jgi:2,5-diketo-D-gluconate reductase A
VTAVPEIALRGGVAIPQLGFGVFQIPADETAAAVTAALDVGYRHIDTAAAYRNEAQVGQAIRDHGVARDEVFVTTKCFNTNHGRQESREAFQRSADRLDLGPVDLYLIHWPVPANDRYVETWQTFIELRDEGLVRAIGVSNFQPAHLERVIAETGETPVVNQVELHPVFQQPALRAEHERLGIVTEAWSPIAQGRVLADPTIVALAEAHGRTPAQIVLRWHVQLGNVVFPKSVSPARMKENFDIFDFELTEPEMHEIAALDRAQRSGPDPDTFVIPR